MRRIGCESGYGNGGVGNNSGHDWGHCEGKLDRCRIGNGCRYVPDGGNGSRLRQSKDDLGIKGFVQNYPSNELHCAQRRGVLHL